MASKKEILDRVQAALEKNAAKDAKKYAPKKPRKPNKKPEAETEIIIIKWAKKNGFEIFRTDASAKYNAVADKFLKDEDLETGHLDFSGDTPIGISTYIEAKAKGQIKNLSKNQYDFLLRKIKRGCFAITVDREEVLDFLYYTWLALIQSGKRTDAIKFLLDQLPEKKKKWSKYESDDFF